MATAIVAGIAAFGAVAGSVTTATAVGIGLVAAGAVAAADHFLTPDQPDYKEQQVQLGDSAQHIDKGAMQMEAEEGRLNLGEDATKKKKRAKGKAAFKIDLDTKDLKASGGDGTGIQVKKPEQLGVQL